MVVTTINSENLPLFGEFLLPEALESLQKGEPLPALGLVEHSMACGAAAGCVEEDSFRLWSLFVVPQCRKKGGGTLLLHQMGEALQKTGGIYFLEAHYTVTTEDHLTIRPFLEKNGFEITEEDDPIYSIPLGKLTGKEFFSHSKTEALPTGVLPFSEVPEVYIKMLGGRMAAEYGPITEDPLEKAEIDRSVSLAEVKDGKIASFILFDHSFAGRLTLAFLYSEENARLLPGLLRGAVRLAAKKYPPETEAVFQTVSPESEALAKKLLAPAGGGTCLSWAASLPL